MQNWEHLLARWVMVMLVFVVAGAMTAPLSALLWRWRRHLSLAQLKGALAVVVFKPMWVALFTALVAAMPPCAHHTVCYFGWLQLHMGSTGILLMRILLLAISTLLGIWIVRLGAHTATVRGMLRRLHRISRPPSDKLQQVLRQVVPDGAHHRFREAPIPAGASGVYAGTCFLSQESVHALSPVQLRAVVAHEWQHLRARDGWFALAMGLLVLGSGWGAWSAAFRRWSQAAELLADERATQLGVPRTELAKTLLHQQAGAQGISLGFGTNSGLLEERLQSLLVPPVPALGLAWGTWTLLAGICLMVLYTLWLAGGDSTCTIHCVLF
ncbi:MAG: hypothetical protein ACP5RN_00060 [Armatimonadota bacterium]